MDQPTDNTTFADLALRPELVDALATLGYEEPTPIQRESTTADSNPPTRPIAGTIVTGKGESARQPNVATILGAEFALATPRMPSKPCCVPRLYASSTVRRKAPDPRASGSTARSTPTPRIRSSPEIDR